MKKAETWISGLLYGILGFFGAGMGYLIWLFVPIEEVRILMLVLDISLVAVCLARIWYEKYRAGKLTDNICESLDDLISGREVQRQQTFDDSLADKVQGKLLQYGNILQEDRKENRAEKQKLQEIISDISHQIKTPMANIRLFSNILKQENLSCGQREEFSHTLEFQVDKLEFLLQSLIKMSRLETGTFVLHMEGQNLYHRKDRNRTEEEDMESIIKVRDLKKFYGKGESQVKALNGVNLNIEKGKFTVITGSSGSGKTTLFNMIGGLDYPDSGSVVVDNIELKDMKEKQLAVFRRSKIGFIYQNYNLIPSLTIKENILFSVNLGKQAVDKEFFREITGFLKLENRLDAYPGQLSGGGQQRVSIARALMLKSGIVLADVN